jgi:hypothetical protein
MRYHPKTLMWAGIVAVGLFVAGVPAAHAQQCSAICNANVDCSTSCVNGITPQPGGIVPASSGSTTCGDGGFPCCTPTTTTTADCTAQFLKADLTCVYVTRSFVTTTCGSNSTTVIQGDRTFTPNSNCGACPSFHTPGCEDIQPGIC